MCQMHSLLWQWHVIWNEEDEIRDALENFKGEHALPKWVRSMDYHHRLTTILFKSQKRVAAPWQWALRSWHRFTRLSNLFDDFCTCFNDADVVAIAGYILRGPHHRREP